MSSEVTVAHSDGRKEVWSVHDLGEDHFARTNHRYAIGCEGGTGRVAKVEGMGEEYRKRAMLMAAAPELLEALRLMCKGYSEAATTEGSYLDGFVFTGALEKARAAIIKATGNTP